MCFVTLGRRVGRARKFGNAAFAMCRFAFYLSPRRRPLMMARSSSPPVSRISLVCHPAVTRTLFRRVGPAVGPCHLEGEVIERALLPAGLAHSFERKGDVCGGRGEDVDLVMEDLQATFPESPVEAREGAASSGSAVRTLHGALAVQSGPVKPGRVRCRRRLVADRGRRCRWTTRSRGKVSGRLASNDCWPSGVTFQILGLPHCTT